MLVSDAIERIRMRVNDEYDTGYTDDILINYINDAKEYLSHYLITKNNPELTANLTVSQNATNNVPANFVRLAGGFPVRRQGKEFYITDSSLTDVVIKYFYVPDDVVNTTDTMPFTDNTKYDMVIINLACVYALNQHEFNIQQDNVLMQQINQIIDRAMEASE